MKPCFNDILQIKQWIKDRQTKLEELSELPPTPERLAEVRKIQMEANDLKRSIKELKGNMYPYAS